MKSPVLFLLGSLVFQLHAAPQLSDATISPSAIPVGQPVPVVFSVRLATGAGDPAFIPGSMNAFRVDASGRVLAALGAMRDDGTNGDTTAGDNIFSLRFTTNEAAAGNLRLMASAAFRGALIRTLSIQVVVGIGGATPTVGVSGGVVRTPGGASLTIRPGALNTLTPITLTDATPADVGGGLPNGYSFLGAVTVDLNGASLATEADLAVPITSGVSGRPIVAKVVSIGTVQRLTLVDTASVGADGLLHTNSPPFPGVNAGGTYAFVGMPPALGIVGLTVLSAGGQPVTGATVAVIPKTLGATVTPATAQQSLNSLSAFVGISGVDGSAFIPGALPRTDVVATAILSPATGSATIGAIDMPLTDILSGGILGSLVDKLIVDKIYPTLPPRTPMCDCNLLAIDSASLPAPPFTPGEKQQLKVACGGQDVTKSDSVDAATIVNNLLFGVSANLTFYGSSDSQIATVSQVGEITAVAPGKADISIWSVSIKLEKVGGVLLPFICFAGGGISQLEVQALLTVAKSGTGTGTVTSSPAGINCGPSCPSQNAPFNGAVQLTAAAASGSIFTGWSGDCTGTAFTTSVNVTVNRNCTATFGLTMLTVTKGGSGTGTVTSSPAGINCGPACPSQNAPLSGSVQLTAAPASSSTFTGWGGDCTGTALTTTVDVTADKSCTATFGGALPAVRLNPFGNQSGAPPYSIEVVNSLLALTAAPGDITVTLLRDVISQCSGLLFSSNRSVVVSQGQSSAAYNFNAGRDPACNTLPITTRYTVTQAVLAPDTVLDLSSIPALQLILSVTR